MGTAIKHNVLVIFDIQTLTLSAEHQSARMSKITNDGLTWSGTVCFCTHVATPGVKGLTLV